MALKHYKNSDSTVFNDAKALFDLNKIFYLKVQQVQENEVGRNIK